MHDDLLTTMFCFVANIPFILTTLATRPYLGKKNIFEDEDEDDKDNDNEDDDDENKDEDEDDNENDENWYDNDDDEDEDEDDDDGGLQVDCLEEHEHGADVDEIVNV